MIWAAIVASGIVTFATRALPLTVRVRLPDGGPARAYLDALPTAIIAALAGAAVIAPADAVTRGAELVGAGAATAVAAWRRHVLLAMLAGVAAVAVARSCGY
ncbi:MAG TPA: AzlD domain-containing protein [Candidatus Limnocylindria bacterium]|nr:AzlD domain-containing protein [Candidatus Limnocylindria bacterium]